jgi:type IV pilus assembly protein PilC
MSLFQFEASTPEGRRHAGQLDAESSSAAASSLRARGWIVIFVRAAAAPRGRPAGNGGPRIARRTFNPLTWLPPTKGDVELSLQQLAAMLRSGMTLSASIRVAAEQATRPAMAQVWLRVGEQIQTGATLNHAMSRQTRCFPDFIVQLVKVGEASGTLDLVLTRGSEQLERARGLRLTLINALMYPLIVVFMAFTVTAYMLLSLIPKLEKFLSNRNKRLPAITQALLDVSNWLQAYLPHIALGIVLAIIGIWLVRLWPKGRLLLDGWLLRIPIVGGILRTAATASFARTLGMLLESGITLVTGLGILEGLLANRALSRHVVAVRDSVIAGGPLAEPLTNGGFFAPILGRIVAVGEATGTLDTVLTENAEFHEKRLAAHIRWLSTIMEPAIIVIVGGIVGFVYIAFFMALYSAVG